jgi:excinuclease UvrABC helicase subunit UvrB
VLPLLRPDGTIGTTRTSPIQLTDKPVSGLERLAAQLAAEMTAAAAALDFELAAQLRDEAAAVRGELDRRMGGGGPDG